MDKPPHRDKVSSIEGDCRRNLVFLTLSLNMISSDLALVLKVITLETWQNVKENLPQSLLTVNTLAPSLQVYLKVFLGRSFFKIYKTLRSSVIQNTSG